MYSAQYFHSNHCFRNLSTCHYIMFYKIHALSYSFTAKQSKNGLRPICCNTIFCKLTFDFSRIEVPHFNKCPTILMHFSCITMNLTLPCIQRARYFWFIPFWLRSYLQSAYQIHLYGGTLRFWEMIYSRYLRMFIYLDKYKPQ